MTIASYASAWEPAPRPAPEGTVLLAIGDVHGHLAQLDALLAVLEAPVASARARGDSVQLVLVGDYIDRGPASLGVLDRVAELGQAWGPDLHCLLGNHDELLLRLLASPRDILLHGWRRKGGDTVLRELGITKPELWARRARKVAARLRERLGPERLRTLEGLLPAWRCGEWLFVHAGVDPRAPLEAQRPRSWLSLREPFLSATSWPHPFAVVHGHTVRGPEVLPHRVAIDSGVYRTGVLTALEIAGWRLRFHCVSDGRGLAPLDALPGALQERQFHPNVPGPQPSDLHSVTGR